jgi:acyl carrier protein
MRREEVLQGVRECVAAALETPAASVGEHDRLIDDLGAESLDVLDLVFQLEQRFKVSISPRDIERRAKEKLDGKPLEVDGVYTPEALAELRKLLPEVPPEELADGLRVAELPRRFRVSTMAGLVCRLLEEKGG